MSEQKTQRERVLEALGRGPLSDVSLRTAVKANASGLRLLLGRMKAAGEIEEVAQGVWKATGAEPIKREWRARVKAEPPEPQPFDCGVFLDGTVVMTGSIVGVDGVVRLASEDAERLRQLLNRHARRDVTELAEEIW